VWWWCWRPHHLHLSLGGWFMWPYGWCLLSGQDFPHHSNSSNLLTYFTLEQQGLSIFLLFRTYGLLHFWQPRQSTLILVPVIRIAKSGFQVSRNLHTFPHGQMVNECMRWAHCTNPKSFYEALVCSSSLVVLCASWFCKGGPDSMLSFGNEGREVIFSTSTRICVVSTVSSAVPG
jgi:hypothetical protein